MKKITVVDEVPVILTERHQEIEHKVIKEMLYKFSTEMYKLDMFEIQSMKLPVNPTIPDRIEFRIEGFVMNNDELKKAIGLLHLIKTCLPIEYKGYAEDLFSILTK